MFKKELLFAAALLLMARIASADLYIEPLPAGYKPPEETNGQPTLLSTQSDESEKSSTEIKQSLNDENEGEKATETK
jgi:hypothetical protein